jgi:tRNA(Arg) A34 adenosine deaminase TadA
MMRKIADRSTHRYRHCSIIFAGSRLLTYGYNRGDTHAEIMAIRRLNQLYRTENSARPRNLHIVNFMYKGSSGNPGNSAPCDNCNRAIYKAGIRRIAYYNQRYGFIQMRFE